MPITTPRTFWSEFRLFNDSSRATLNSASSLSGSSAAPPSACAGSTVPASGAGVTAPAALSAVSDAAAAVLSTLSAAAGAAATPLSVLSAAPAAAGSAASSAMPDLSSKMSDMVSSTSFIVPGGVDAPAVTPIARQREKSIALNSSAVSIRCVSQCVSQTALSFAVFELSRPPMTIIMSHSAERASAWACLSPVALHIVSNTTAFVQLLLMICLHASQTAVPNVVCATAMNPDCASRGSAASSASSSSAVLKVKTGPRQQLIMPRTSG